MSDAQNDRASDRVRVELIEADVDMAFSLLDDAHAKYHESNAEFAHAALEDANKVVMDIEDRLLKLYAPHSARFRALARSFGRRFAPRKPGALSSSLDPAFPTPRSILFPYTILDQGGACPPAKNLTN